MYKKIVLSNNLRIITHDMKERDSTSLGIWIGAGGRYENDKNKGVAHFLEHILFKGSKKYSCNAIKELIEGVGGSLNAFTSEECTCYFAKIPAQHLIKTFDILADMVLQPLIKKKDVDKERGVILEEIKMYRDLPQHFVLELFDELLWPNHPLGKNLAGSFESVGSMSYQDLRKFHETCYSPDNIVIAASGRLKHQQFIRLIQKKLGKIAKTRRLKFMKANNTQDNPKTKFFKKDIEQMHLVLGCLALSYGHKDRHALNLLNVILGGNMSSRLFNQVREKRGLAYAISSGVKSLKDTGVFMVRAGVDNRKIVDAFDIILTELKKIGSKNVSQSEFKRARDYYLGQLVLGLEDTLEHMLWIGESTLSLNKTFGIDEILKEVKRVTVADIKRVASNILREERLNLSVVGPLKNEQEQKLRNLMKVNG